MYRYAVVSDQTHDLHAGMTEIHYQILLNEESLCHGRIWDSRGKWAYTCHADRPVPYGTDPSTLVPKDLWGRIFKAPGLTHSSVQ